MLQIDVRYIREFEGSNIMVNLRSFSNSLKFNGLLVCLVHKLLVANVLECAKKLVSVDLRFFIVIMR
jgi:hypothetical protein